VTPKADGLCTYCLGSDRNLSPGNKSIDYLSTGDTPSLPTPLLCSCVNARLVVPLTWIRETAQQRGERSDGTVSDGTSWVFSLVWLYSEFSARSEAEIVILTYSAKNTGLSPHPLARRFGPTTWPPTKVRLASSKTEASALFVVSLISRLGNTPGIQGRPSFRDDRMETEYAHRSWVLYQVDTSAHDLMHRVDWEKGPW
jgi:hypothetical protein